MMTALGTAITQFGFDFGKAKKEKEALDRRLAAKKFKIKNALTSKNYETLAGLKFQVHLIKEMQVAQRQNNLSQYFNNLSLYN